MLFWDGKFQDGRLTATMEIARGVATSFGASMKVARRARREKRFSIAQNRYGYVKSDDDKAHHNRGD